MTEVAKFEFLTEEAYALLTESQQLDYLKRALDFHCSDVGGWRAFFSDFSDSKNDPVPERSAGFSRPRP